MQGCRDKDVGLNVLLSSPSESKGASDKITAEICIVNLGRFFCFLLYHCHI